MDLADCKVEDNQVIELYVCVCVCVCVNNSDFLQSKSTISRKTWRFLEWYVSWVRLYPRTGMNIFAVNGARWEMFEPLLVTSVGNILLFTENV